MNTYRISTVVALSAWLILIAVAPARAQTATGTSAGGSRVDRARATDHSGSSRLVTGDSDHLQRVVDGTVAGSVSFFQLKPVAAQGNVTYGSGVHFVDMAVDPFDLTFNLDGGTNERLFFELQAGGWGGHMDECQAAIDWVNGYASGAGADLQRVIVPCDPNDATQGEETCRLALGRGSRCDGIMPNSCRDAFINSEPAAPVGPPGIPDPRLTTVGLNAVNLPTMAFGSIAFPGPGQLDVGQVGYNGAVAVDVPDQAAGTYTIGLVGGAATFMVVDGASIVISELRPLVIKIGLGRCCVTATNECLASATQMSCDAAGGTFFLGGECTVGACCTMGVGGPDCNHNGIPDVCEIADVDCNGNNQPDDCDIASGFSADCNGNLLPDECDTASGASADCNADMVPDECQPNADCNGNGTRDICDIGAGTSSDCNFDFVPDECQPNDDCNANGIQDICDIGSGASGDCNGNLIPDDCDIAIGTSVDANGDGVPDECCASPIPIFMAAAKSRYLSLASLGTPGVRSAIRITMGVNESFPAIEGRVLWVGPPNDFPEEDSSNPSRTFVGARLSCRPYFQDWNAINVLQVFGPEIVPNSAYTVQVINEGCPGSFGANYSSPAPATTGQFGDLLAPYFPDGLPQPNFGDINGSVAKFLGIAGAPIKAVVQLAPSAVGPDGPVSFRDINAVVQSFLGRSYLDSISDAQFCDCPSLVTCGAAACQVDADCAPGLCLSGFCTDPCGRCSP